jgi:predicted NAD/FAD-dependent oxidoreductase
MAPRALKAAARTYAAGRLRMLVLWLLHVAQMASGRWRWAMPRSPLRRLLLWSVREVALDAAAIWCKMVDETGERT